MIVEDNVVSFPALQTAGRPFVRIVSCQPLEIRGDDPDAARAIPPAYSGLPRGRPVRLGGVPRGVRPDPSPDVGGVRRVVPRERAPAPLPELEFMHTSRRPEPLHLPAGRRLRGSPPARPRRGVRLDSTVRATDAAFELPAELADRPAGSALIYLSLGSLGSADVELMRRLVAVLADTPHRYIVSKGPQHAASTTSPRTCGARSSCRRPRSCRSSTS